MSYDFFVFDPDGDADADADVDAAGDGVTDVDELDGLGDGVTDGDGVCPTFAAAIAPNSAAEVADTCLPLTNTVGVELIPRSEAFSVSCFTSGVYFSFRMQSLSVVDFALGTPARLANAVSSAAPGPAVPSFGWNDP